MDIAQQIIELNGLKFKINVSLCSQCDDVDDLIKFDEGISEVVPEAILINFDDVLKEEIKPEVRDESKDDKNQYSKEYYKNNKNNAMQTEHS